MWSPAWNIWAPFGRPVSGSISRGATASMTSTSTETGAISTAACELSAGMNKATARAAIEAARATDSRITSFFTATPPVL